MSKCCVGTIRKKNGGKTPVLCPLNSSIENSIVRHVKEQQPTDCETCDLLEKTKTSFRLEFLLQCCLVLNLYIGIFETNHLWCRPNNSIILWHTTSVGFNRNDISLCSTEIRQIYIKVHPGFMKYSLLCLFIFTASACNLMYDPQWVKMFGSFPTHFLSSVKSCASWFHMLLICHCLREILDSRK